MKQKAVVPRQDFIYVATDNEFLCPAGQRAIWRFSAVTTNTLTSAGVYCRTAATTTFSLDRIVSNTVMLNGRIDTRGTHARSGAFEHGFDWTLTRRIRSAITIGAASLAAVESRLEMSAWGRDVDRS